MYFQLHFNVKALPFEALVMCVVVYTIKQPISNLHSTVYNGTQDGSKQYNQQYGHSITPSLIGVSMGLPAPYTAF